HATTTRGRNVRPRCYGKSILNSSCYSRFSMPAQLAPGSFSLGAVFCWGTSDFLGGVATRRASTFLLTSVTHFAGASLMLVLAVLAFIGVAGFFLCATQAGRGSALWMAAISRGASLLLTTAIVFLGRQPRAIDWRSAVLGSIAGFLDSSGTALFIRASQTGRLDAAVVISSLYPAITVLLARFVLHEHLSRWKLVGMAAALAAVALIAV